MPTTDSGTTAATGLREAVRLASLLVATTYGPMATGARVIVTLPACGLARLSVVSVPARPGARARDLIPAIDRIVRVYYPEAEAVDVCIALTTGREAWMPVSSTPKVECPSASS